MAIEVALDGRLGIPRPVQTSAKGTRWRCLNVAVRTGGADDPEWVSVACFGEMLDSLPDDLIKGEKIYAEDKLSISRFTDRTGAMRASLQVKATRVLVLDRIGRRARKPRRQNTLELEEVAA
jgi:single-strand DNA-binding protein